MKKIQTWKLTENVHKPSQYRAFTELRKECHPSATCLFFPNSCIGSFCYRFYLCKCFTIIQFALLYNLHSYTLQLSKAASLRKALMVAILQREQKLSFWSAPMFELHHQSIPVLSRDIGLIPWSLVELSKSSESSEDDR